MNEGINLLSSTKKVKVVEPANVRLVRLIGLSILFLISASAIILFILISFSPLPGLQKKEQELVNELSTFRPQIAGLTVVSNRVTSLEKFVASRQDFPDKWNSITAILPEDVKMTLFKANNKDIDFSVQSKSLASLDTVIKRMDSLNKEKKLFTKATMQGISLAGIGGIFELEIELTLP